jgi:hypothetical protein
MKKHRDFFGNEITDPWCLDILQRLDRLKKRNKGRKHFSEEDKKEFDAILKEQDRHWEILKKELDKIPASELVKRIQNNLKWNNLRPFDFGSKRGPTLFDISIFDSNTIYRSKSIRKGRFNEGNWQSG